jgi:uncharacterized membrane protein YgcG
MKSQILLLALIVAALSSCTTAYKTGQTPDDVYFSPVRAHDEYVQTDKNENRNYQSRDEYYDDRYLRMKVNNRMRWSELDDWYSYGSRYDYSYYNSFNLNNPWSPCSYWNNHYNPYYQSYVIVTPKSPVFNHPRTFNLNTYNNNMLTNNNYSNPTHPGVSGGRPFGSSNSNGSSNTNYNNNNRGNSNAGNLLRNIFSNNNSSGNSNSSSSSHPSSNSSSSSSSSSSSGSSGGGGSAPVRRF